MNYHVFIVDTNTFKYHLEYMFAGTGAGQKTVPFLNNSCTYLHSTTERNLVGMIADISRVRKGDKIIFYLQATNGNPGLFYGVFKAASSAFFDENDNNNYLKDSIYKPLTFRIRIEPDCVYPIGVSEHEYLDSLKDIKFPFQMCWSLIYRKLKGNRGCTMITDYEFESLVSKLKFINNNKYISTNLKTLSFNNKTFTIEKDNNTYQYSGRTDNIDIKERMLFKANKGNAFEVHLQAYILQNFDKEPLRSFIMPFPNVPCWVGNEVSCGVGMQRIDIMIIQENKNDIYIKVIELKCVDPYTDILDKQLPWYINWVTDYIAPNYTTQGKKVHIIPCVIAQTSSNRPFLDSCLKFHKSYNPTDSVKVEQTEYIGFDFDANEITFRKIV